MGNCIYCGKPAGFLRGKHIECEKQYLQRQRTIEKGKERIVHEVQRAIKGTEDFTELEGLISEIEETFFVPSDERNTLLIEAWETSVDQFLEDGVLEELEEKRLNQFKNHFALSQNDLDKNGAFTKITKVAILRDVLSGVVPQRMSIVGSIPINFQKGEQLVWVFPGSEYLEDKIKRQYVGGSQGVSLRVMKGVYYRTSAFKGNAVEYTQRTHIDTGWVVITDKHIYFAGPSKSLRIAYSKVLSFLPFSDGFGVLRDAATAKPQIFVTGDGWFSYNLVINLAQL